MLKYELLSCRRWSNGKIQCRMHSGLDVWLLHIHLQFIIDNRISDSNSWRFGWVYAPEHIVMTATNLKMNLRVTSRLKRKTHWKWIPPQVTFSSDLRSPHDGLTNTLLQTELRTGWSCNAQLPGPAGDSNQLTANWWDFIDTTAIHNFI